MKRRTELKSERYSLKDSPLYGITTQRKLALLLRVPKAQLIRMIRTVERDPTALYKIEERQLGKKIRALQVPIREMRELHERTKELLGRIELPEYLMSPRKQRSVVSNATAHRDAVELVKIDIKDYYPSTSRELVFRLFFYELAMPDDVAGLLAKLLTINEHVAVGSPVSPILAFWASKPAFDRIETLAKARGLAVTLWVDDLTFSGIQIAPRFIEHVCRELNRLGYVGHKVQFQTRRRGFSVTGVRIDSRGLAPSNDVNLKLRNGLRRLGRRSLSSEERARILAQLIGLNGYRLSVLAPRHPATERARRLQQGLKQHRRFLG